MKNLIFDVFSGLLFMVVLLLTKNIYAALTVALLAAVGQLIWSKLHQQKISTIQWLSVVLIIISAAAAIGSHNPRFIMMKPALLELCIAISMLRPNWIRRYLSENTIKHLPAAIILAVGYIYASVMLGLSLVNAVLALNASQKTWAVFNGLAPPIVFAVTGGVLYLICRRLVQASMLNHRRSAH